ncbi:MAG: DUF484 family protein [Gammaproteobacteria bacterium]|nr:DUF484 family protein [Gammaproteobacteria bacterium]
MSEDAIKETRLLKQHLRSLVDQARQNEEKMRRFQAIELQLISAANLMELIETILYDYREAFHLDALTLMLVDPANEFERILKDDNIDPADHPDMLFSTTREEIQFLSNLSMFPTLGHYKKRVHTSLFPNTQPRPETIAILPLVRHGKVIGCMNLGSYQTDRFENGSATDFLERIAAIVAISLENTLNSERLKRTGLTDPLTRINNRRFFDQRLGEEVSRAHRNAEPLSCLFFDVDHFKRINDNYGHQAGDQVLAEVASLIAIQMRTSDVLSRYGGEEFSALLSNTEVGKAMEIAERIRINIQEHPFKLDKHTEINITLSIGVATLIPDGDQSGLKTYASWLVGYADRALLHAKETGRNQVKCAGIIHASTEQQFQGVVLPNMKLESSH